MRSKNSVLKVGKSSKKNLIYKCSSCGNLHAMIEGETAPECEICRDRGRDQHWVETKSEILIAAKDIRKEIERRKTAMDRISDAITDFCGNIHFVYVHVVWFTAWLIYNMVVEEPFDPYPFGMLTLVVSLEAIMLATFILMSQNRQGEISELRSKLDYQTDLKSEKNTAEILAVIKKIYSEIKKNNG